VGRVSAEALALTVTVSLQGPSRHLLLDVSAGSGAFLVQPDVVGRRHGRTLWILDTKWKVLARGVVHLGVVGADIYQMIGYGHLYGCTDIVLLFPHTSALGLPGVQRTYRVMTPRSAVAADSTAVHIRVCTLAMDDLTSIPDQLRRLLISDFKNGSSTADDDRTMLAHEAFA
jgi:5-methylcytosine-specific restriction enzyme subunit McrC